MEKKDLKIGLAVSFHKLKNGKINGLEKEIYIIKEINFKHWGVSNCLLHNDNLGDVFTNHEAIEIIKNRYEQLSLF